MTNKYSSSCIHGHTERYVVSNNCVECVRLNTKRHAEKNPLYHKHYVRQQKYGTDGVELLKSQDGLCAMCSVDMATIPLREQHIDHNHSTGAVRGVLCGRCNRAVSSLGDNPTLLKQAVTYLSRYT